MVLVSGAILMPESGEKACVILCLNAPLYPTVISFGYLFFFLMIA